MPANSRWDLIRRLRVNVEILVFLKCIYCALIGTIKDKARQDAR